MSGEGCPRSGVMVFVITGFRLFGDSRVPKKNDGNNAGDMDIYMFFSYVFASIMLIPAE